MNPSWANRSRGYHLLRASLRFPFHNFTMFFVKTKIPSSIHTSGSILAQQIDLHKQASCVQMLGSSSFCFVHLMLLLLRFSVDVFELQAMDREERSKRAASKVLGSEFFLQWGNKKRLRCVRVRDPQIISQRSDGSIRRKITSRIDRFVVSSLRDKDASHLHSSRFTRNSESATLRSAVATNRKSSSPEKENRYYTTRGSVGIDETTKVTMDGGNCEDKGHVWPKLYITLSSKEKEEDFMAMKGCKLPQRPKKRAKIIQRSLLMVSPGAWLTDMCQERYEVREKKSSKKRPRGLKAMGTMDSDSE